jgi:transcriptional regulator CtsR
MKSIKAVIFSFVSQVQEKHSYTDADLNIIACILIGYSAFKNYFIINNFTKSTGYLFIAKRAQTGCLIVMWCHVIAPRRKQGRDLC